MDRHNSVTRAYMIPGQTWPSELCWLYDNLRNSYIHVEVGVFCGRSLFTSCCAIQNGTVYAVDRENIDINNFPWPDVQWPTDVLNATIAAINATVPNVKLTLLQIGSLQAARQLVNLRIDSVFIDAGHEYEHAVGDIEAWLPLIREGGLICGHDYDSGHPGVRDAVNYLLPGFSIVPDTRIWYKRV